MPITDDLETGTTPSRLLSALHSIVWLLRPAYPSPGSERKRWFFQRRRRRSPSTFVQVLFYLICMVLYLPFLYVAYSPLWWLIVPSSMLVKAIIDHIFVQRAKKKALADSHTSDMDAEANPFIASAYVKQYTTSGLGVLFIMLVHDLDPTRAGLVSLLACWVSMLLSPVWYLEVAQSLIVTCYV